MRGEPSREETAQHRTPAQDDDAEDGLNRGPDVGRGDPVGVDVRAGEEAGIADAVERLARNLNFHRQGRKAPDQVADEIGKRTGRDHRSEAEPGQRPTEGTHHENLAELSDRHGRADLAVQ